MKAIICFAALIAVALAYPAQDGAAYTNEAIRQAQSSHLIPQNAQIQKVCVTNLRHANVRFFLYFAITIFLFIFIWQVEEGIELGALENIPGNQRVDLYQLLGSQFPPEVIQNLQRQIDTVGRN